MATKKVSHVAGRPTVDGLHIHVIWKIGISGCPNLIDGGSITVPAFRIYNPDGSWFKEGHGVDPDIDVEEDLTAMAKGIDPQLERAIAEIKDMIIKKGYTAPKAPPYEKR